MLVFRVVFILFLFYKYPLKFIFSVYYAMGIFAIPNSTRKALSVIFCHSYNFKLFRIVFIQITNWHAHYTLIITRDSVGKRYFYRIIIVIFMIFFFAFNLFVLTVFQIFFQRHKRQWLMPAPMVKISEP